MVFYRGEVNTVSESVRVSQPISEDSESVRVAILKMVPSRAGTGKTKRILKLR